ncbi:MAG: NADH-quinone oxidoreductase subunit C [Chitinophagales bacterium]|nr:NADH-quinone oxidoreductase subunit C [Chitinophagales bacterium]
MVDNERVLEKLKSAFGELIHSPEEPWQLLTIRTDPLHITPIIEFLSKDEELAFTFLTDLCGIHWPYRNEKFEVVYHLHSFINNIRLRIKVAIPGDQPRIPTMTNLFLAANWMERETFDFYGIIFVGHPNLVRILNVDEMTIFPLRKEYPLEDNTREDKNDEMFGRDPKLIQAGI